MDTNLAFGLLLALIWGYAVAWFIRDTEMGIVLSNHLMWFVVSIGCGVTLLITLLWLDHGGLIVWWKIPAALGVAGIPIAYRSLDKGFVPMLKNLIRAIHHNG